MPERPDRCETCRAYLEVEADRGQCHRRAPAPELIDVSRGKRDTSENPAWVCWPMVLADEFCAEWIPVPVSQRREVPK